MAKKHYLNMRSTVRTLSIKIYDEQLPEGWEATKTKIVAIDKGHWQVIAICHDRDYAGDNFWLPSLEKKHYHIIVRVLNGKNARVEQILRELGVVYRPQEDKILWQNHGVETCRDFAGMAMYIPHWTEQAELDGKARYEMEELVSNLTAEEIRQIMEGYTRVSDSIEKVTPGKLAELDADAFELGRNLGNFDKWYGSQPFSVRSQAKMKTIRESYERGVDEIINSMKTIPRLSIFVKGDKNMGKTKAAEIACDTMGLKHLDIEAGGTGKFDNLTVNTDAIIVDDETLPHPLAMADTKVCRVYKRHRNNPPWIGTLIVVTSNLSFSEWIEKCGIKDEKEREAARSRFYICRLENMDGVNMLYCEDRAKRGSPELKRKVREMYEKFRDIYNQSLEEYQSFEDNGENAIDVNGDLFWERYRRDREREEKQREAEEEAKKAAAETAKKKKAEERRRQKARDEAYKRARDEFDERVYKLCEQNVDFKEILNRCRAEVEKERAGAEKAEEMAETIEELFSIT